MKKKNVMFWGFLILLAFNVFLLYSGIVVKNVFLILSSITLIMVSLVSLRNILRRF